MKRMTSTTIAALLVAAIALGAGPAFAQDQGPGGRDDTRGDGGRELHMQHGPGGHGMRGGLLALNCSPDGADQLAHVLLGVSQRTDPTGDQVALFDAYSSTATAAQSEFAATCAANLPAEGDTATRDLVDRMGARLKIDEARIAAMGSVIPAFEAFYDSLSAEQKAALEPHERDGKRHMGEKRGGPGPEAPAPNAPVNG